MVYVHPFGAEQALLGWVKNARLLEVPLDPLTGQYALGYSKRYRGVVALFTLLSLGFLALGIAGRNEGLRFVILYYAMFTPLALYMLLGFRDAFFRPIRFNESGIFAGPAARIFIPWTAIAGIRRRKHMGWVVVTAQSGRRIYITNYRDGLLTLGLFVSRSLGPEKAAPIFEVAGVSLQAAETAASR